MKNNKQEKINNKEEYIIEKLERTEENLKLLNKSFLEFAHLRIKEGNLPIISDQEIINEFIKFYNNENLIIYIVKETKQKDIKGFIIARQLGMTAAYLNEGKTLYISYIYINKDLQGKGLSTKLFKEIEKYAKNNDYFDITLSVNVNNENAMNIYKHWGFEDYYMKLKKKISK